MRLTAGSAGGYYDEENPAWSPDGSKIAFLSDARSQGQLQLYVADADRRNVRELAHFTGDVQRLTWSPSGNALAVLYIANAHRKAGALAAGARDVGVIGAVVDEQRLALIDARSGTMRYVTPADVYVYEYGWSPDGREIAATYAKGNGDDNWWIARLARVDVATATMHDLLVPSYQIDDPQWSPDGSRIAIIGGIMSDFGPVGGDVYLVDAQTGEARDATPGASRSRRSRCGGTIHRVLDLRFAHVAGSMHLMRLDLANGASALTSLTDREESLPSWSTAGGGATVALVRASFDDPRRRFGPEARSHRLRQITRSNAVAPCCDALRQSGVTSMEETTRLQRSARLARLSTEV